MKRTQNWPLQLSIEQQKDTEFPQAIDPKNENKTQKRCLKKTQHNMIYMIFL